VPARLYYAEGLVDILTALKKLGDLENSVGKLYEWFATLFQNDEKAREFFKKLAEDEQAHFDIVKYQERVVRKTPKDFEHVDMNLAAVEELLWSIKSFRKTTPCVKDAIGFALHIETEIVETYAATIMDKSNKNLAEMVKGMTHGFKEDHYKQLIQFAAAYE
jgi:rubrerythrin